MKSSLNLHDYLSSSGKYLARIESKEVTIEVIKNAEELNRRVNPLLDDMGLEAKYSSGFRPVEVNGKLRNAAKRSNHTKGAAGDLDKPEIGDRLLKDPALLEKHNLYMEHPDCTVLDVDGKKVRWTHLQSVPPRSGSRIFRCGLKECVACRKWRNSK